MATLKTIDRSATVAFAPTASIMAVGTMAGAIDPSFSSAAALEILQLDFANTGQELPVVNSCATSERFNRLSWGRNAYDSEEYALGIIAGGLVDGSVNLWNPAKLVSGDGADPADSLLLQSDRHSGAVRGLEFSTLSANLLASGGDEGDLYIWDLKVPTAPNQYPPLKAGSASGAQGQISYLSWNRKVPTVLAATSNSGTSVVWDLRKQKPVLSFTDPNSRRRCSTLQWHPDNATQLVVASDDDRSPSLQIWDLRNSVSPLREFVGHSKGVLAMAWCPMDSSLLLTCAKDQLTLCWDTVSGEVLCELPASNNWNFDVQWSPRIPGVLSTSSFDGNVSIYNIEACSRAPSSETTFGRQITGMDSSYGKKAPKWLKRPVGVSYGFGGKLVTFKPMKKLSPGEVGPTSPEICLHSLVTEDELVKQSTEFESAIAGGEKPVLRAFCDSKAETAGIEDDRETWRFLKVMFEDDARRKLLTHLNFEVLPTENELQDTEERPPAEDVGPEVALVDEHVEGNQSQLGSLEDDSLAEIGEDSFFDNLQTPRTPEAPAPRFEDLTLEANANERDGNIEYESGGDEVDESEEAVQRALVVGDFKAAVQHCLAASRVADALILAYVGGSTLWEATQNEYINKTGRPYLKILSAVVNNDLQSLVEKRPLKAWKETLAILCTYARSEDWTILSDALAARLDAAHESQAATLCYICSGNIEKAAEIWSRSLETAPDGRHYVQALQIVMEKVVVLSLATGQKRLSTGLARLVTQYADLLVSQGLLQTAQEYLSLVPADQSSLELAELQHRIHGTGVSDVQGEAPAVPWEVEPLGLNSRAPSVEPSLPIYPPATYTPYPQNPYPGAQLATDQASVIYPPQDTPTYAQLNFPQAAPNYVQPTQPGMPASTPRPGFFQPSTETTTPYMVPSTDVGPYGEIKPFAPQNTFTPQPFVPQQTFMLPTMPAPGAPPFMPSSPKLQPPTPQVPPTPQSPQLSSIPAPVAPPAPAPTVQNVDTSSVAGELKGVVVTLTRLYNETSEAFGGSRANPAKRREIENNSRKLGALFSKLNNADLSANASSKLIQLCQALDIGDYATALQIQVGLTTSDWDECGVWLAALKQMIKIRQTLR